MGIGDIAEVLGGEFDTSQEDAATGFEALKAGWYPVQIEAAEIKDTKAKTGKYLKVEMTVLESEKGYAGRKLFPNINLINPNETAVEIGQRELAALGQACGLASLQATEELVGKIIQVRVKVRKGNDEYEADNEVTAYKAVSPGQEVPTAAAPTAAPTTKAAPTPAPTAKTTKAAAPAKRPWER